jgi:hypothetical protein
MQQVINAKDRNQAFAQFLVFFLIAVILTVAAVYFNFKMPSKLSSLLAEEVNNQRNEEAHQQRFLAQMHDTKSYLDSLLKKETNVSLVDMQLTEKITALLNLRQQDSTLSGQMNKAIIEAYLELQQARKTLISMNDQVAKIGELQADLAQCKNNLNATQLQLDNFRTKPVQ